MKVTPVLTEKSLNIAKGGKYTFKTTIGNDGDSPLTQNNFKLRIYSQTQDTGEKDGEGNPIFVRLKLCTNEIDSLTLAPGESRAFSCEYEVSKTQTMHTITSKLAEPAYETFPAGHGEKAIKKFPELGQNKITLPLTSSNIGIRLGEGVTFIEKLVIYI